MKDYRSPITLTIDNAESKFTETVEGLMFKEVCKLDLNIDKEELMKALAYDRNQYLEGYNDAKKVFKRIMKDEMKDLKETIERIIEKFGEEE